MTREEYYQIAWSIRDHMPDAESGTVAEKILWNKILRSLSTTLPANCTEPVHNQWFEELANNQRQNWREGSTAAPRIR
jgi:hypothetical protein